MISKKDMKELAASFRSFDFEGAMDDIYQWQQELDDGVQDTITYNAIEGFIDILLDRSEF